MELATKESGWMSDNLQAISSRLAWLVGKKDGRLLDRKSEHHRIAVYKDGSEIRLHFVDPRSAGPQSDGLPARISGRMSEMDLKNPLFLIAPYTQALTLPLIWKDEPQRVYTIGFGGGRVPMILHHHLPHVAIESTEIDAEVIKIAASHFGVVYDERQKVVVKDGREYLKQLPASTRYDFILNDAFRGTGYGPVQLSTVEFYSLCKEHLVEGGMVGVNLVESDPIFLEKINTIQSCFKSSYLLVDEDATVVFGTDSEPLEAAERMQRAEAIQQRHRFAFDFLRKARALKNVSESREFLARKGSSTAVLTDQSIAPLVEALLDRDDPIFFNLGRNDLCPCGSGKKFKKCHGR